MFLLSVVLGCASIFLYSTYLTLPNAFRVHHNERDFRDPGGGDSGKLFCDSVIWIITEEAVLVLWVVLVLVGMAALSFRFENPTNLSVQDFIRWDVVHDGRINYDTYRSAAAAETKRRQRYQ